MNIMVMKLPFSYDGVNFVGIDERTLLCWIEQAARGQDQQVSCHGQEETSSKVGRATCLHTTPYYEGIV